MATKTGLVELTVLFKHVNRVLAKYSAAVNAGVALGVITSTLSAPEAAAILAALSQIQASVAALQKLTGY